MSSVEYLRDIVNERLTAAAEEIFGVFKKTIIDYEEEIDRQRKLLDTVWKPETNLHGAELLQQHVCTEKEILTDEQLCNQERNSSLDQEDPEPPRVKEEEEELFACQEGEQLELKQETDTYMLTTTYEERRQELLSHNSHEAQSPNQKGSKHRDAGPTRGAEPKPKKRHNSHTARKPFKCDPCGKAFKYKSHFDMHLTTHTGEMPYLCTTCGERFNLSSALNAHVRLHTGEKQYSCNTCGITFSHKSGLIAHTRTHTGEKPYMCNTCGKRFKVSSSLNAHIRLHTGEKPFSCDTCGKHFRCSSNLVMHMRVHTGEKPYLCNTCGKKFSQSSALNTHIRLHKGEEPFLCNTCGKRFNQKASLNNHLKVHLKRSQYSRVMK